MSDEDPIVRVLSVSGDTVSDDTVLDIDDLSYLSPADDELRKVLRGTRIEAITLISLAAVMAVLFILCVIIILFDSLDGTWVTGDGRVYLIDQRIFGELEVYNRDGQLTYTGHRQPFSKKIDIVTDQLAQGGEIRREGERSSHNTISFPGTGYPDWRRTSNKW